MVATLLFFGDVVGRPGRRAIDAVLPELKIQHHADFVIVNGENAAGGSGLTGKIASNFIARGANMITTGDHFFRNKEFHGLLNEPRVLRPANYPESAAGFGFGIYDIPGGKGRIGVINLIGRIFMEPARCPFLVADALIRRIRDAGVRSIIIDMHAEATSEKIALGWYTDGRVTAVIGTHTHVQTNDPTILPKQTAFLTDAGMCGPHQGVIGREVKPVLHKLTTHMPMRFDVAKYDVRANGAVVRFDETTGQAISIETFTVRLPDPDPAPEHSAQAPASGA